MSDDRGTSVTMGYVLALAITVVLVAGLMTAAGGFVERQEAETTRTELRVLGEQVATDVTQADRLADAGGTATRVRVYSSLPERVGGQTYTVRVAHLGGDEHRVTLRTRSPSTTVTVGFVATHPVQNATVSGGDIRVRYRPGPDELEVTNAAT